MGKSFDRSHLSGRVMQRRLDPDPNICTCSSGTTGTCAITTTDDWSIAFPELVEFRSDSHALKTGEVTLVRPQS